MQYQREETPEALTIEQIEGYIICLTDRINSLKGDIVTYKIALKCKKKFKKGE